MKSTEFLTETLSRIVYHYTRLPAAAKIMQTGDFQLSSDLGSIEQQYSPKGYRYFLSTTRTKTGGYHNSIGSDAVLFVLDGNWFNQRYISKPIDYWLNRDPTQSHHKTHEAEDRVFSKTPTIPVDGVTAIHILITEDNSNEYAGGWARTIIINAKRRGIKTYLYNDEAAWRALDTRKSQPLSKNPQLRGQQHIVTRQSMYNRKGYLHPWLQLITATDQKQLTKDADSLRRGLSYAYDIKDTVRGLGNEMSNARQPRNGIDRENAVKIISYMRQNRLNDLDDLVAHLVKKWVPVRN
jgi:hypothetical protein